MQVKRSSIMNTCSLNDFISIWEVPQRYYNAFCTITHHDVFCVEIMHIRLEEQRIIEIKMNNTI